MSHLQRPIRTRRRHVRLAASALLVAAGAVLRPRHRRPGGIGPGQRVPHPRRPGRGTVDSAHLPGRARQPARAGLRDGIQERHPHGSHRRRLGRRRRQASFRRSAFKAGETVTVSTGSHIAGATPAPTASPSPHPAGGIPLAGVRPAPRVRNDISRFVSRPDLVPAAVTVTKKASPSVAAGGDLFVAPQYGPAQNGPMIIGPFGGLIWYQPVPPQRHRHRLQRPELPGQAGADLVAGQRQRRRNGRRRR